MKISAKCRYGLASMIYMAEKTNSEDLVTINSISEKLSISKIYLEQVFSLIKRAGLVNSTKGSMGGYQISRPPGEITVFEILASIEASIFEKTQPTVERSASEIEAVMQNFVFSALDASVESVLKQMTLEDLISQLKKLKQENDYMFYI